MFNTTDWVRFPRSSCRQASLGTQNLEMERQGKFIQEVVWEIGGKHWVSGMAKPHGSQESIPLGEAVGQDRGCMPPGTPSQVLPQSSVSQEAPEKGREQHPTKRNPSSVYVWRVTLVIVATRTCSAQLLNRSWATLYRGW